MTPDQITALTAVAAIVSKVGTWPIGSIIAAIVGGPWVAMYFISNGQEKRYRMMVKMYEDNVILVKAYETMSKDQSDTIRLATAATTELTAYLKLQVPCHERLKECMK